MCRCCSTNLETVLRKFRGQEVALEGIKGHVGLTGVFRDIPADRCVPDFGVHEVMRVAIAGVNGIVRMLLTHGGVSRKSAASMVHMVLNRARTVARTVGRGKWGADKANAKGLVRIERGVAAHFVKARLWGILLQLVAPVIGNLQVVNKACRTAPAIVRAPPPIPDFSTLFPVTPIVLALTSDSMCHKIQCPKFLQVPLATLGHEIQTNPVGTPLATLAVKSKHLTNRIE